MIDRWPPAVTPLWREMPELRALPPMGVVAAARCLWDSDSIEVGATLAVWLLEIGACARSLNMVLRLQVAESEEAWHQWQPERQQPIDQHGCHRGTRGHADRDEPC